MIATLTLYHHSTSVCSAKVRVALGETYRTRVDAVAATFGIAADIGGRLCRAFSRARAAHILSG
jgi:hypothetical protein